MRSEPERWMDFADEDLRIAKVALKDDIYNQVCFHSQQCIEKSLKALIYKRGIVPPKIHDLMDLLKLINTEAFVDIDEKIAFVNDFYIPVRYPDTLPGSLPDRLPGEREKRRNVLKLPKRFIK